MKKLIAVGILVGTVFVGIAYTLSKQKQSSAQTKLPFVVRLHDSKTGRFFCSGSVVSKTLVLTAAHCIVVQDPFFGFTMINPKPIEVRGMNGEILGIIAKPYNAGAQSDLGLVEGDFSAFNTIRVASTPAEVISSIMSHSLKACGFPYGGHLFCNRLTNVTSYYFGFGARGYLYPGMSGGPVIDEETGYLVAVNSAVGPNMVLISPTIEVFEALRKQ